MKTESKILAVFALLCAATATVAFIACFYFLGSQQFGRVFAALGICMAAIFWGEVAAGVLKKYKEEEDEAARKR